MTGTGYDDFLDPGAVEARDDDGWPSPWEKSDIDVWVWNGVQLVPASVEDRERIEEWERERDTLPRIAALKRNTASESRQKLLARLRNLLGWQGGRLHARLRRRGSATETPTEARAQAEVQRRSEV